MLCLVLSACSNSVLYFAVIVLYLILWIFCIVDDDASEEEEFKIKELGREKPGADIAREIWSAKEQDGTSVFSDESDKATSKG